MTKSTLDNAINKLIATSKTAGYTDAYRYAGESETNIKTTRENVVVAKRELEQVIGDIQQEAVNAVLHEMREWFTDSDNAAYDETGRQTEYTRIDWVLKQIDRMGAQYE